MRTGPPPIQVPDLDVVDTYDEKTGRRYEVIDGEVIMAPPPVPRHQALTIELVVRFNAVVQPNDLGGVYTAPVEVQLATTPRPIPDLVCVTRENREMVGDKVIEEPPDLVAEILSLGTRRVDLGRKRDLCARHGIPEYRIVDPKAREIMVPVLDEGRVARSRVLPGSEIGVAEFFAAARW
jgi:Uma2 family endonuclease